MARDCIVYYLLFNQIQITNSKKSILRPRQEHCGKYENRNRKHLFKRKKKKKRNKVTLLFPISVITVAFLDVITLQVASNQLSWEGSAK